MIPTQEDVNSYLEYLARSGMDVLSQDSEWLARSFALTRMRWRRGEGMPFAVSVLVPYVDEWRLHAPAACC